MYKKRKFLAVITARGGSKGIPKKNIKTFAGKPLITHTIKAARASRYLDYFLVSTDDKEIAAVSKKYKAPVPFLRPAELATDKAKSIPVMTHAIQWLKENKKIVFDYAVILQPTSPLRTAEDIDECIKMAVDKNADSVMSIVELSDFSPAKLKKIEKGLILPFFEKEGKQSASKHELSKVYKRNCAIYLTKTKLLEKGDMFGKKSFAYIMPPEKSVDINTPLDFLVAEILMKNREKRR